MAKTKLSPQLYVNSTFFLKFHFIILFFKENVKVELGQLSFCGEEMIYIEFLQAAGLMSF